ncbi:MAG TPA: SUMF1/EgtB/PvdO family nonheme iron enzyme [Pyrinomonadaceae bacterium]|nr:SUMF1/EgtB/PvdO family nonheme iron enzyme [Pyrinomonadaceae bacterium]
MKKAVLSIVVLIGVVLLFSPPVESQKTAAPRVFVPETGITFLLISPGRFQMGSPENEPERGKGERQHWRTIKEPFYISETEVTVEQFRRFVKATAYVTDAERGAEEGGHTKGAFATVPNGDREWSDGASWQNPFPNLRDYRLRDDHPVVQVSWNDAKSFAKHFGLYLPTEAQWEYAARAGSKSAYLWGNDEVAGNGFGNVNDASAAKRFCRWNRSFPFEDGHVLIAPVRSFKPNSWGLHDVTGNVAEWCEDVYVRDYPADGADESAATNGNARVLRGGSWLDPPDLYRMAKRFGFAPQGRRDFVGFRVVMKVGHEKAQKTQKG